MRKVLKVPRPLANGDTLNISWRIAFGCSGRRDYIKVGKYWVEVK